MPDRLEEAIAEWQGITPPNEVARRMAQDTKALIRAMAALHDGLRFEDEPSSFEAALKETRE
jgi:hypothetical protein